MYQYNDPVKVIVFDGSIQGKVVAQIGVNCLIWTGKKPLWVKADKVISSENDIEIPLDESFIRLLRKYAKDYLEGGMFQLEPRDLKIMTNQLYAGYLRKILNDKKQIDIQDQL